MMEPGWITTAWDAAVMAVLSAAGIYAAVILFTRRSGLRSFSKMSSFDFAMTVAVGSVVAGTVLTRDPPLLRAVAALGAIYAFQMAVAVARVRIPGVQRLVDNEPLLLMEDGRILEGALRRVEVTRHDLIAKLREANVIEMDEVRAVVMETTGDISVLHGPADGPAVDDVLLDGVRRY